MFKIHLCNCVELQFIYIHCYVMSQVICPSSCQKNFWLFQIFYFVLFCITNNASMPFLCTYAMHENSSIFEWNFWIVEHENVQDYKRVPNCYLKWLNQFIAPPSRQYFFFFFLQFSRFLSVLCPMWRNSYEHFWIWIPDVGSGTFQKLAVLPKLSFLIYKVRGNLSTIPSA